MYEDQVKEYEETYAKLKKFVAENNAVLAKFRTLAGQYNDMTNALRDQVKSVCKESRARSQIGPFSTTVSGGTEPNLDALEEIVSDDEFRTVVDIKYKLKGEGGKAGKQALAKLREQYGDRLKGLDVAVDPRVTVHGPKPLDLGEIEGML